MRNANSQSTPYLLSLGLLFCVIGAGCGRTPNPAAFKKFFSSQPDTVQLVSYGYDRTVLGDGSYVHVFRMPAPEFRDFMKQEGYAAIGIETDPGNWELSLCNSIVRRLVKTDIEIDATFDCYSKVTPKTAARVFYDSHRGSAVYIGRGYFPR